MTVSTTLSKKQYTGNGVTVNFSFPYNITDEDDLIVVLTDIATDTSTIQVLTTNYTVALADDPNSGCTVVMNVAPTADQRLTIYRDTTVTQDTEISNQSAYFLGTFEDTYDHIVRIIQEIQEELDRCLKFPVAASDSDVDTDTETFTENLATYTADIYRYGGPYPWSSSVTYSLGAIVLGDDNNLYRSTSPDNLNNDPTLDDGTHWAGITKPCPIRSTLSDDLTFTENSKEKLILILDPNGADRNVDPEPGESFPDGFEVVIVNIGSVYNLIFDSTGLGSSVTPGDRQSFYYLETEDEWI